MRTKRRLQDTKHVHLINGHHKDVHSTNFFPNVSTIQNRERMYVVDSGALLRMMGLSSLTVKERAPYKSQAESWILRVSDSQARVYIQELGSYQGVHMVERLSVSAIVARLRKSSVVLIRGRQEELHYFPRAKALLNVVSSNSSPWLQLPDKIWIHP